MPTSRPSRDRAAAGGAPRARRRSRIALAGVLLAALPLLVTSAATASSSPLALRPLHAAPDPVRGGRIVDDRGREVLLRGVNVNALADYWKGSRRFPTVFPLERRDPDRMAAIGWNAVRLLVSWSRVEPRPGVVDQGYLDRVDDVVRTLARRGIYTIVDMHQDAWGPSLAAQPGERCTPPAEPALGWDGAPAWATLSGAAARCVAGPREGSPAVLRAWAAFFADEKGPGGVGVQTRFVRTWGRIAKRFARMHAVAGFDLLNEPGALGAAQDAQLSRMYARALAAIRAGERAGRGRRHLVLYEPSVLFSAVGSGAPPRFTRDRDVVYAPHLYTGGFTDGPITREAFRVARDEAKALGGVPVLSGEWGADPKRAGSRGDGYFVDHQRLQDDFRVSATLWTWRESCGDPHKIGELRAGVIPEVWGEWDVRCTDNRIRGKRDALVSDLERGYVRAAPGRLTSSRWDGARRIFSASGVASAGDGPLVVFSPRSNGTAAASSGLRAVRALLAPGGASLYVGTPRGGRWSLRLIPLQP